jgi:hypothetical protein
MSERVSSADEDTLKLGLLMEGAQAHQRSAELHLERLRAHTQDLDGVVRHEIRRTLVEEVRALTADTQRASQALREMKRAANMRGTLWSVGIAGLCTAIPLVIAHAALPSAETIATLRTQRDALAQNVARLELRGGKVDWRTCGDAARLCVRVDKKAPVFGEAGDYVIVKGY